MSLIDKLRAARESWVTVEGVDLLIRRPTKAEVVRLTYSAVDAPNRTTAAFDLMEQRLRLGVVGWRGVKESDIIGAGGGALEVAFDTNLFIEWARDREQLYGKAHEACLKVVEDHEARQGETEKN